MVLAEPICHPFTRQVIWPSGTKLQAQHIRLIQKMDLRTLHVIDLENRLPTQEVGSSAQAQAPAEAPSPAAKPGAFRLTKPVALGGSATSGIHHPAPINKGAPSRPATASGAPMRPRTIQTEVLERNVQTIKKIQSQVRAATNLDIQSVDSTVQSTIQKIVTNQELLNSLIDLRVYDEYTYSHSSNVMSLALVVGTAMGYSVERLRVLGIGALLHDIGKSLIPEAILHKPSKLSEDEFNLMATHPANSIMILSNYAWATQDIKNIVFQHHEKYDGSGYPVKLSGNAIAEMAKIVAVVDVYDALISQRPYKKGLPPNVVYQAIMNGAGTHFDPRVVQAFVKFIVPYPVNSLVELNTGQIARVARVSKKQLLRPVIELEGSFIDMSRDERFAIVAIHQASPAS